MPESIEPKEVFHYFEEISKIPRGSYNEKMISDYLVSFAKKRDLEVHQDKLNNVIIIKEATEGFEDKDGFIIQGHMDMVCEKDEDISKDMTKEGIDLDIVDGFVTAKGTTLGGDDGIAIAYALALLDSDSINHPRIEVVCTVSEEVGMEGANGIDLSFLQGKKLLNIDYETEGLLIAGCAGGGRIDVDLKVDRMKCEYAHVLINIDGLLGGHSGDDINKGRASSFTLMVRIIKSIYEQMDLRIVSFKTGKLTNVISKSCTLELAVSDVTKCKEIVSAVISEIKNEYSDTDRDIHITIDETDNNTFPLSEDSTIKVSTIISSMPQGVKRMSERFEGEVETSINWGVCELSDEEFRMEGLVRSELDDRAYELLGRVKWIAKGNGATSEVVSPYPAWQFKPDSILRDKMCSIYKEMFDKEFEVKVVHAGLECGFLVDKIKGVDAVSFGPDILDIHTPRERMDIESVRRIWEFLLRVLEEA